MNDLEPLRLTELHRRREQLFPSPAAPYAVSHDEPAQMSDARLHVLAVDRDGADDLPPSRFVEEYFGLDFEVMCREWPHDAAVAEVNGMQHFKPNWEAMTEIAKSILAQATEEGANERALVEAAQQDKADPSAD